MIGKNFYGWVESENQWKYLEDGRKGNVGFDSRGRLYKVDGAQEVYLQTITTDCDR